MSRRQARKRNGLSLLEALVGKIMRKQHAYVHHPEILQLVRRAKAELHVPAADHADDQTVRMCFETIGDPAGESTVSRLLSPHETIELRSLG